VTTSKVAIRCAIYTRKSSEEGLDQEYNSLHAQRDACSAYVLSQAGEGWKLLPDQYDDGGFSGGNIERPGLAQLLADIEAKRVDVVVVYKVDRLTRSLSDFAKIIDTLDRAGASFVSVTQAFNTTTSMGRLTLNVLLSFAQFEREVTGERIRDKIASSKKLGMWMGGNPPLGYRAVGRTLEIVPEEAATVREIFRRYLEIGSVHRLRDVLADEGVVSKKWVSQGGRTFGGVPLNRGALFHLLRNRTYLGEIKHKDASYPGRQPAILDQALFDQVQRKLDQGVTAGERRERVRNSYPLAGLLFDTAGQPMSGVRTSRKGGAQYRYYVSSAVQTGKPLLAGLCKRAPASLLETLLKDRLSRLALLQPVEVEPLMLGRVVERITLGPAEMVILLKEGALTAAGGVKHLKTLLRSDEELGNGAAGATFIKLPVSFARAGMRLSAVGPNGQSAISAQQVDRPLLAALIKGEAWKRRLLSGDAASIEALAAEEDVGQTYASRVIRTAFLAPDLKRAIMIGAQPRGLTLQRIVAGDMPVAWEEQRRLFST